MSDLEFFEAGHLSSMFDFGDSSALDFPSLDKFDLNIDVTFDFPPSPQTVADSTSSVLPFKVENQELVTPPVTMSNWSASVLALDSVDFSLPLGPIVDGSLEQTPPSSPTVLLSTDSFGFVSSLLDPGAVITHIDPSMIDFDLSAADMGAPAVFTFGPTPLLHHMKGETTTDTEDEELDVDVVTVDDTVLSASQRLSLAQLTTPFQYMALSSTHTTPASSAHSSPLSSPLPSGSAGKLAPPKERFAPYSRQGSTKSVEHKRQTHNQLERKRRDELKSTFDALCAVVPDMAADSGRVSKLQILQGAGDFLRLQRQRNAHFTTVRDSLRSENAALLERLRQLQARA